MNGSDWRIRWETFGQAGGRCSRTFGEQVWIWESSSGRDRRREFWKVCRWTRAIQDWRASEANGASLGSQGGVCIACGSEADQGAVEGGSQEEEAGKKVGDAGE